MKNPGNAWLVLVAITTFSGQGESPGQMGTQEGFLHVCLPSSDDLFLNLASSIAEPTTDDAASKRQRDVKYRLGDMMKAGMRPEKSDNEVSD